MTKRPEVFWQWFAENRSDLERALVSLRLGAPADEKLTEGVRRALEVAGFDLAHEIGQQPSGRFHLIISADGDRSKIEDVMVVTRAAIQFDNWEVMAFRPPSNERFSIEIQQNRNISTDPIWFFIEETLEYTAVGVIFDAPAALEISPPQLSFVARRLIEMRIGEYKLMNDIDYVFGIAKGPDEGRALLRPISEFEIALRELDGSLPS